MSAFQEEGSATRNRCRPANTVDRSGGHRSSAQTLAAILLGCCISLLTACRAVDDHPASAARALNIASGDALFRGGMVATAERLPAEAAVRILEQGGNAIDAAAAAQFMLNVVEPQSSGIGGGGFTMIHLAANRQTIVLDSRETAPAAASPAMFLDAAGRPVPFALASTSGYAVGVPGALRGIATALDRWGTISLADALAPAIAAAEDGIVVDERLARSTDESRLLNECDAEPDDSPYDAARAVFRPGDAAAVCGRPLIPGSRLRQPDLARTFRLIAAGGARVLYDCDDPSGLARAVVATQRATRADNPRGRGEMTCRDLADYQPVVRAPVVGEYRGYVVKSAPPPSSGGLSLLQMLKMLERFPLGDAGDGFGFGGFATLNVMQEAMRIAFADRAMWIGDADRVPDLPLRGLIDADYLRRRSAACPAGDAAPGTYCVAAGARIPDVRAGDPRPYEDASADRTPRLAVAVTPQEEGHDTTHLTIVDRWGNVVSCTTTVEAPWGSGLMVGGFGVLLNNEMTDFNVAPRRRGAPDDADFDPGANDVAPGKRPRSSMAPTMLFVREAGGERPVAAFGSPGGSTIINTVLNFALGLVDDRLPVGEAVARPRISLTNPAAGATTSLEAGFDAGIVERLRGLGYRFAESPAVIGAVQAVVIDPRSGRLDGAADPRRSGTVIGLPLR